jgi:hypothetical protein
MISVLTVYTKKHKPIVLPPRARGWLYIALTPRYGSFMRTFPAALLLAFGWVLLSCGQTDRSAADDPGGVGGAAGAPGSAGAAGTGLHVTDGADFALGCAHSCAIRYDGSVWCWGDNLEGQLGDGTESKTSWPVEAVQFGTDTASLSIRYTQSCALAKNGSLRCTSFLADGAAQLGASVVAVAIGAAHACAIKGDGTTWCWGNARFGSLGNGTDTEIMLPPVQVTALGTEGVSLASGSSHTCAIKKDGTLWCWGFNNSGQVGVDNPESSSVPIPTQVKAVGTEAAAVVTGGNHTCVIKQDRTLWCWGMFHGSYGQVIGLGADVASAAAWFFHTCALKLDGSLWCWGTNAHGQLGDGTTADSGLPVRVSVLGFEVAAIAVGGYCVFDNWGGHTCVRKRDGSVWCWGSNAYGQLGDGTTESRSVPTQVSGL